MIDYYYNLKADPHCCKQIACKELLLLLNYDRPKKTPKYDMRSGYSYFIYLINGSKSWYKGHNSWKLTAGDAIFVKRGACLVEHFSEAPFCMLVFVIPDFYIISFLRKNASLLPKEKQRGDIPDVVIPVKADDLMTCFYKSVLPYFGMEKSPPEQLIELKFQELLLNLLNNPSNTALIAHMNMLLQSPNPNLFLHHVMEQNFSCNLRLEEFARLCNRSLSSFKRDFSATLKTTPGRWLTKKRLEYAQELLSISNMSVSEISLECGFENHAHFSRAFKQRFGYPPKSFRKQLSISA